MSAIVLPLADFARPAAFEGDVEAGEDAMTDTDAGHYALDEQPGG